MSGWWARWAGRIWPTTRVLPILPHAPRMRPVLADIVGRIIATDTTEGWLERLRAADILADRVNGFDDWLADPHVVATGGAVRVEQPEMGQFPTPRTPGIPLEVDAALPPAPRIGEHGAAILAEIGVDPAAIASLCAENIVLIPEVL